MASWIRGEPPVSVLFPVAPSDSMAFMLTISTDSLPQTSLTWLAFRVAFQDTLERIALAKQIDQYPGDGFGYLTEVPFLRGVPPHVQLDLLADTWRRHQASDPCDASLVDESVVYAVCETAARVAEHDPSGFRRLVSGGPLQVDILPDQVLASELRSLHLKLSSDGDFLIISQFEDMAPDDAARMKREFRLDEQRLETMFDVLGRWQMSTGFLDSLSGLMEPAELGRVIDLLGEGQPAIGTRDDHPPGDEA